MTKLRKRLSTLLFQILQPPPADPGQTRLTYQLYYLLLLGIPIAFSFVFFDVEVRAGQPAWRDLLPAGAGVVLVGLLLLVRRGYVRLAAIFTLVTPLIAISLASFTKMGIRNPALMVIPLILMLSSWLLGSRVTTFFAVITSVMAIFLYFDEQSRAFSAQLPPLDSDYLLVVLATIAVTTLILHFTLTQLLESNERIRQQAEELHKQNLRLAQAQHDLEARTHQLSKLNAELQLEMSERARTEASLRQKQKLEPIP